MANLNNLIKEFWPESLINLLEAAGEVAHGFNYKLFVVGGAVRDLLLGRATNLDLDLVVEGNGVEVAQQMAARIKARLVVHNRFGTATLYPDGKGLDIITARREDYPHPGALPVVQFSNLADDLFRRDFTINTLAMKVEPGPFGELIDPYGGQQDLENRLIRILHPKSFIDDATRILRALRYEQRLGFRIEESTAAAIRRDIAMLDTISGDRLRHELELIMKELYPERIFRRMDEVGALSKLVLSWKGDSVIEKRMGLARQAEPSSSLYLALFVYPLDLADTEQFIARMRFPQKVSQILRQTLELKTKLPLLASADLLPSDIYRLLKEYSPTAIQANALATSSLQVRQNLYLYLDKLRFARLLLKGNDLVAMGVEPGPILGKLLDRLMKAKLNGEAPTREDEIRLVQSWLTK
ncbi:MAG: CCA tRNA nucleotidyltransferase [Dehalococcoidia bacterium]|nr:CCA tRNA nucleotidyltransferase [Dehalococcoidia bacterium]